MNILQVSPAHLSDVATLPWEIQTSFFNINIHNTSDCLRYLRKNEQQLLYCSFSRLLTVV